MKTATNKCEMFGNNIKKAMEKENKSVEQLSVDTGLDASLIKSIISGREEICEKLDSEGIIKIARALKVEETELFCY